MLQPPTLQQKIGSFREQGHFDHIKCTCHNLRAEQQAINRIHRLNSTHEDVYFFKLLSENNSAERRMLMVGQLQKRHICNYIHIYAGLSRLRDGRLIGWMDGLIDWLIDWLEIKELYIWESQSWGLDMEVPWWLCWLQMFHHLGEAPKHSLDICIFDMYGIFTYIEPMKINY